MFDHESGSDDEDVGKDNNKETAIDYNDSDDGGQQELVSMDTVPTKRNKVPKLKKPVK